ncbi:Polygalacturonase [Thalictrum thalictroides]|uniref:Polygalacturonase n=1 Tax=Thalictrum thalictroides TaxID=46969 RepID=A0A7J6WZF4_THATH|nr:Polygalacturonase [Thalictrum thalictroides]
MTTMTMLRNVSLLLLFFISLPSSIYALDINVTDFGAKGDGKTDASPAFLKAWKIACSSLTPTTIYVPRKRYFLSQTIFQGPCMNSGITFRIEAILTAPDYKNMGSIETWVMFDKVEGVTVVGGFLDGRGSSLWACKATDKPCPAGASTLAIYSSKNITIQNVTSINAKLYHVVIHSSENVIVQGVRIHAPEDSPNTDGIHVQNSMNVSILNTGIKTGDDCVSIGPGTKNLWIQRVACGPGHGISIGSLAKGPVEEGVENVVVKNVVFTGTQNGLRIKAWGRPSTGYVKGVVFKQVVMNNVQYPIVIDQNYCPRNEGCPGQHSGIQISDVSYSAIKGTSATKVAMKFDCSAKTPCKGISVQDIKLTYKGDSAESFCQNVRGVTGGSVFPPSCL